MEPKLEEVEKVEVEEGFDKWMVRYRILNEKVDIVLEKIRQRRLKK